MSLPLKALRSNLVRIYLSPVPRARLDADRERQGGRQRNGFCCRGEPVQPAADHADGRGALWLGAYLAIGAAAVGLLLVGTAVKGDSAVLNLLRSL